ncbi:dihydrofolate reductase family protein [Amnibacterium setariae]|uniref:Deaminase n=1 Tax=Amnibacterium setariae TaxID=2306585 RepID=A0A3A1UDT8_9MICO|nr:dihydrofolate reductase family protein [Amnibacterium setariae]RIX31246.1 deaminase [Amnibacterium setariae]
MAPLTAFFTCSLDLRLTDGDGRFDWAEPPEDVHAFANDLERTVGTHLYGRRMWETMRYWATAPDDGSVEGEYGRLWRRADHVVFSTTLDAVDVPRTRLERRFDADAVRRLKAAATAPLTIGGAGIAAHVFATGLVDELQLLLVPVVVGEGPRVLPDGARLGLELLEQRTFPAGWVHLRYAVAGRP